MASHYGRPQVAGLGIRILYQLKFHFHRRAAVLLQYILGQLGVAQVLFHPFGGNGILGNAFHDANQAAGLGNIHPVGSQLDGHAGLHPFALVHADIKDALQLIPFLGQTDRTDRTACVNELSFRNHHFVNNAFVIGENVLAGCLLVAFRVKFIDTALHVPVAGAQFRTVLGHAGIRRLLRLFHAGNPVALPHVAAGFHVHIGHLARGRMGYVHYAGRIKEQTIAVRFFRKGSVNGPQHNGKAKQRHGCQSHPAHRAGDADHGVQLVRRTELLQGFGVEDFVVCHFVPPPCTVTVARIPFRKPSVPEVTTTSPSCRPSRTSMNSPSLLPVLTALSSIISSLISLKDRFA